MNSNNDIEYLTNMNLANTIVKKLRQEMISSNDIIPSIDIPHFYTNEMGQYIARFGEEKVKKLLDYQTNLTNIRNTANELSKRTEYKFKYPKSTIALAVSMCGVGECHEGSNRVAFELLRVKCNSIINVVLLEGRKKSKYENKYNNHCTIIIGDCSKLKLMEDLSSFKNLDDHCIVIDYLLGFIGKANQFHDLLHDFVKVYGLCYVSDVVKITPHDVDCDELFNNATFFASEIKKNLNLVNTPKHFKHASCAFFAETDPLARNVKMIHTLCQHTDKGKEILEAFNKGDFSLALRRASAYGFYEVVQTLTSNKMLFHGISINAQSSNGYTALDWVIKSCDINESVKNLIKQNLIENGALTAEQLICNKKTKQP